MPSPARAQGHSYAGIIEEVRAGGVTLSELADLTGVSERQVQNWASGTSRPRDASRDRLVDVHYIVQRLRRVYEDEGVEIWLHARNPGLDGRRPIELLLTGRFEPVIFAVESLVRGNM